MTAAGANQVAPEGNTGSSDLLDGFADVVEAIREEWQVPGIAVTAVYGGEIIFSHGFGFRDGEQDLPVTPTTLFPLASVTKSFTATAMAAMVDDGLIDWDTPVKSYMPDFQLYDPLLTDRITPRDLLAHITGIPRHDALWFNRWITRGELVQRLRYLKPNVDLRTTYQYSNLMYMAAGYLIGMVGGSSYEDVVRWRLLEPLGMKETNFSISDSKETDNCSHGHAKRADRIQSIPYYERQQAIGPCGMIVSNSAELGTWVQFHLDDGRRGDGKAIISPVQMRELRRIQLPYRVKSIYSERQGPGGYGLGWSIDPLDGQSIVSHGGGINGFSTFAAFTPALGAGIAILANLNNVPGATRSIAFNYFERCIGIEPSRWSTRLRSEQRADAAASERLASFELAQPRHGTETSHSFSSYAGMYEHPAYGVIEIAEQGGELRGVFTDRPFQLTHHHYDVFRLISDDGHDNLLIRFITGYRGDVESLEAPWEPTSAPIVFARVWAHANDQRLLERLAGDFVTEDGQSVSIRLRQDGTLTASLSVLELRDVELVAVGTREFALKGTDLLSFAIFYDEPRDDQPIDHIYCRASGGLRIGTRVDGDAK